MPNTHAYVLILVIMFRSTAEISLSEPYYKSEVSGVEAENDVDVDRWRRAYSNIPFQPTLCLPLASLLFIATLHNVLDYFHHRHLLLLQSCVGHRPVD